VRRGHRGFHLTELLVALALGLLLVAAFLSALQKCRALFAIHESISSLQDTQRHVLSVLVPDLEHAGFFGFHRPAFARLLRAQLEVAAGPQLRQLVGGANVEPVGFLPAGAHACGINFAVDTSRPVQGTNNSFGAGTGPSDCAPTAVAGGARTGADTLSLRRASLAVAIPHAGRIQLYTRRLESLAPLDLFGDGRPPGPVDPDREVRDLEVHLYYIANNSVDRSGWPALRVKTLTESGGAAQFRDEEVLPGVEDLQVEFGIAEAVAGASRLRFVAADFEGLATARIVAVRIWLRVRADSTEPGYFDDRALTYADASFRPSPFESRQRRMLIERTVSLRNAE
jgi:type IV pilus assembly protein PilW